MKVTKLSSREFNLDVSRAKRAADKGLVIITDRGEPAYVLLRHASYARLAGKKKSLAEILHHRPAEDVDFELPPRRDRAFRPIDLS